MASYQYIFTMKDLRKVYPGGKEVLKGIHLQFFPGAKIGILGANGSGKSTLLRIMAQEDREIIGEAWPADGVRIGYLPQEPRLDPNKNVKENIEEAVADMVTTLKRFEEVSLKLGEVTSDDEMNRLLDEQAKLQDKIEAGGGWELDHTLELAMDALRTPPPDARVDTLSGGERRRVALAALLAQDPRIYLLDEPINHLDPHHQLEILKLLCERAQQGRTVVMSLHDVGLAARFCDSALLLFGDGSWQFGRAAEVLNEATISRLYAMRVKEVRWESGRTFVPMD